MAEVKIVNTEILADEKYPLKSVTFEFRLRDEEVKKQTREIYQRGDAASALLYNKQKRTVILVEQLRIATYLNQNTQGTLIEACAGLIDENETPEESIKREIKEETGFIVEQVDKVTAVYSSAGSLTELLHLYTAEYSEDKREGNGGGLKEEGEDLNVLELAFDKAMDMIVTGEIKDAKTIILLQYAKLKGLL